MKAGRSLLLGMLLAVGGQLMGAGAYAQGDLAIADGVKVSLEYILTLPDKSVADSNVGQEPIIFVQGAHEIVPGLEKALDGMKAGQKRRGRRSARTRPSRRPPSSPAAADRGGGAGRLRSLQQQATPERGQRKASQGRQGRGHFAGVG